MELAWGNLGERMFETGIDRGVLFVDGLDGVAWNGLINVTSSPSGGSAKPYYIDGVKYLNLSETEEFAGSISALYSPEEFDLCDGAIANWRGVAAHQQVRRPFCFSFRTRIGNDILGVDLGYKIHIIYNAMALPTTRSYSSAGDDTDVVSLTWRFTTRSVAFPKLSPTAHITIDSTKADPNGLAQLEAALYGTATRDPYVPYPIEILGMFTPLAITDNGDGTFTVTGDIPILVSNGDGTFQLSADSVTTDGTTYSATSP